MEFLDRTKARKKEIDAVSPTFCLAKWLHVDLHLHSGFNNSCHHPDVHQTPLSELEKNPSALHNTEYKKAIRAQMRNGIRASECEFCWQIENSPGHHFSDRIYRSTDEWSFPRLEEIKARSTRDNVNPTYAEVSFSNDCNFRCCYCKPNFSSSIWKEYEKWGPYVGRAGISEIENGALKPIPAGTFNPYIEAFWKWFPELVNDLRVLRLTGGEPLLNENTFKIVQFFATEKKPHLELSINSNLGIPRQFLANLVDELSRMNENQHLKCFRLFTSIDTHGSHAEYLRAGLKYAYWSQNVDYYLKNQPWPVTLMVTFSSLAPARFIDLLRDVLTFNQKYPGKNGVGFEKRVQIDITHLMKPEYLAAWILPTEYKIWVAQIIDFMETNRLENVGPHGFYESEILKIRRIYAWMNAKDNTTPIAKFHRARFFQFTEQYLEREGKEFPAVFPEMTEYYGLCKKEFLERPVQALFETLTQN